MRAHAVQGLKSRDSVGEKGKDGIDNYMLFRIENKNGCHRIDKSTLIVILLFS